MIKINFGFLGEMIGNTRSKGYLRVLFHRKRWSIKNIDHVKKFIKKYSHLIDA
jgi:hypothetical protein